MAAANDESTIDNEIKDFCEKINGVLRSSWLGVGDVDELCDLIYEDHDVHAHSLAQRFGFPSFKDFLHSEHMKGYVDIETGNNVTTYHFPLSTLMDDEKMRLQNAHNTEFLQMDREMKLRRRNGFWVPGQSRTDRPNLKALLLKRYKKRMGIHDPEDDKPKPPPTLSARGVWYRNRESRRKAGLPDLDITATQTPPSPTETTTPSPEPPITMTTNSQQQSAVPASMTGRGGGGAAQRGAGPSTSTTRGIRTMWQPGMLFGRGGFGRGGGRGGSTAGRAGLGRGGIGGGGRGAGTSRNIPSLFDEFFTED